MEWIACAGRFIWQLRKLLQKAILSVTAQYSEGILRLIGRTSWRIQRESCAWLVEHREAFKSSACTSQRTLSRRVELLSPGMWRRDWCTASTFRVEDYAKLAQQTSGALLLLFSILSRIFQSLVGEPCSYECQNSLPHRRLGRSKYLNCR
jgi:hypothetical protein